jgi:hypothetical protein
MAFIFVAYAGGRLVTSYSAVNRPRRLADTVAYLRISNQPIMDVNFWGSTRPFVFPLLLKITDQNLRLAGTIQLLLVPPHPFLAWHGDAMAPKRHALSVALQLYLGVWILVLLVIKCIWAGVFRAHISSFPGS